MELEFFEEHEAMLSVRRGSFGQAPPARSSWLAGRLGRGVGDDGAGAARRCERPMVSAWAALAAGLLFAALAVTATLLLIGRLGPPAGPDGPDSGATNSSGDGGGGQSCDVVFGP